MKTTSVGSRSGRSSLPSWSVGLIGGGYADPVWVASELIEASDARVEVGFITFASRSNERPCAWPWARMSRRPSCDGRGMSTPRGALELLGPIITLVGRRNEESVWAGLRLLLESEGGDQAGADANG